MIMKTDLLEWEMDIMDVVVSLGFTRVWPGLVRVTDERVVR